jgi:hypothetical protein
MEGGGTMAAVSGNEHCEGDVQKQGNRRLKLWGRTALFILFLFGLGLSVAFPFGIGFAVFIWIIALAGSVCGVGVISYRLLREMLGTAATFGYAPNTAYMAGKKTKKRKREEVSEEEKDDNQ